MRFRTRPALTAIFLILVIWVGWLFKGDIRAFLDGRIGSGPEVGDAMADQVVVLRNAQETVFSLAPGCDVIRVLTNADIPVNHSPEENEQWRYAIRITLRDADNAIIEEQDCHYVTSLSVYTDNDTAISRPISRYWQDPLQPLNSRKAMIKLNHLPRYPARIGITILNADSGVRDVVARVYCDRRQSLHKLRFMWQRMRADTKERVVKSNIYPVPLVTDAEIRNALEWRWEQLPPDGIAGKDFVSRVLYTHRNRGPRDINHDIAPEGIPAGPALFATLPVPEEGARVRAHLRLLETETATVDWLWYGKGIANRRSGVVTIRGGEGDLNLDLQGGLLELRPSAQVVVKAFREQPDDSEPVDITPKPSQARSYLCMENNPVEFAVRHLNNQPAEFRLRLRSLLSPPESLAETRVLVQMLNDKKAIIGERTIILPAEPSFYDCMSAQDGTLRLSEPLSRYFLLPPEVSALRVAPLSRPILVNGFNRPPLLVRSTPVPEGYFTSNDAVDRNWFPLRARSHFDLDGDGRVALLLTRKRPPQPVDPDILQGNYTWRSYRPEGDWQARYLFLPKNRPEPEKSGRSPVEFSSVSTNAAVALEFVAPEKEDMVAPSLVFLGEKAEPRAITVTVDGEVVSRHELYAKRGEVRLSKIHVGTRNVTISISPDARCFLNHVRKPSQLPSLKRFAFRVNEGSTQFTYDKTDSDRELLMVRLYSSATGSEDLRIKARVQITGPGVAERITDMGPFTSWTFTVRDFTIRLKGGEQFPVLGTQTKTVDAGQAVFLPLNHDLKPGRFTITVSTEGLPADTYMVLSRTQPGKLAERKLSLEDTSL